MRAMTRMWQLLLKALEEVAAAPNPMMAAEMAVIRLTHMADLPSPEELVRKLQNAPAPMPGGAPAAPSGGGAAPTASAAQTSAPQASAPTSSAPPTQAPTSSAPSGGPVAALATEPVEALSRFTSFNHVVELIRANRDVKLLVEVETCVQLAAYAPGRIEFVPTDAAPRDLAARLGARLQQWTGNRWAVTLVNSGGKPTIAAEQDAAELALKEEAAAHPLVQATIKAFPQARILRVTTPEELQQEAAVEALPEVEDEWDPFEDG